MKTRGTIPLDNFKEDFEKESQVRNKMENKIGLHGINRK